MDGSGGTITWQVRAADHGASACAFDATIVRHDPRSVASDHAYHDEPAPFERTIAREPLTLVVRSRDASVPLMVTFECLDAAGAQVMRGTVRGSTAIVVHATTGTTLTRLPERAERPRPDGTREPGDGTRA